MELMLNDVLNLSEELMKQCKFEFNMWDGDSKIPLIDTWLTYDDENKKAGTCTDCSYWGGSDKKRNFKKGQIIFSFVRMYKNDQWLLISAARIVDIPANDYAKVEIIERFKPFFGRLIVQYKNTNTFGSYIFYAQKAIEKVTVLEILPSIYSGEKFNGYENVNISYRRLKGIFEGKILRTYDEALSTITGIYCLTDTKTGRLYIGSATGCGGIKQRWGNYLDTKHGGNKKLIELYNKEGEEYFEQYFTFTLLEYFGLSYDPDRIRERERYWKRCLDTIHHGYNDNL